MANAKISISLQIINKSAPWSIEINYRSRHPSFTSRCTLWWGCNWKYLVIYVKLRSCELIPVGNPWCRMSILDTAGFLYFCLFMYLNKLNVHVPSNKSVNSQNTLTRLLVIRFSKHLTIPCIMSLFSWFFHSTVLHLKEL